MKKIINLLFVILFSLNVVSCNQQPEQVVVYKRTEKNFDIESPSYKMDLVLEEFKKALSDKDFDSLFLDSSLTYIINDSPADIVNKMIEMINSFDYQIVAQEINGNNAIVKATFSSYDFVPAIKKAIASIAKDLIVSSVMNSGKTMEDVIIEDVIKALDKLKEKGKEKNTTSEFYLSLIDNEWQFDMETNAFQLLDAISGGLMSSIGEIQELIEKIS